MNFFLNQRWSPRGAFHDFTSCGIIDQEKYRVEFKIIRTLPSLEKRRLGRVQAHAAFEPGRLPSG